MIVELVVVVESLLELLMVMHVSFVYMVPKVCVVLFR